MSTPVAAQNTAAFRLSVEELLYLLSALNLKTIPDLGGNPFRDISPEQKEQILMSGFNGLHAKGWVEVSGDEKTPIVVDKLFASTLLVCAKSPKMLSVITKSKSKPSLQAYLYRSPEIIVAHRLIDAGVHEFVITSEQKEAATIFEHMIDVQLPDQPSVLPDFSIPGKEAANLMELVRDRDLNKMRETLLDLKINNNSADAFLDCLENLSQVVTLILINFPEHMKSIDDLSSSTVSILNAAESSWIIENEEKSGVRCSPLHPDSLATWLRFFS